MTLRVRRYRVDPEVSTRVLVYESFMSPIPGQCMRDATTPNLAFLVQHSVILHKDGGWIKAIQVVVAIRPVLIFLFIAP